MTDLQVTAPVVVDDRRLLDLIAPDAAVERLGGGATWSEGPLYLPDDDAVIWSDIPGKRVLRWSAATGEVTVEREGVEFPNGRTADGQGRVVECSHGERAVLRREHDGTTTVLAAGWNGLRLNSPNDVIVRSDGSVWFSDPAYGITTPGFGYPGVREYGDHWVFRVDPDDLRVTPVVLDVEDPNGLAFSPDESILYVSDTSASGAPAGTGNHHIRAYDVVDGQRCKNGRVVADVSPGIPDGFRVDALGHIWTSSQDSVQVFAPDGSRLGKIPVPELVTNLCFGGPDGTTLFIGTPTGLYRLATNVRGAERRDTRTASLAAGM
jgi:gluconolactonase